MKRFLKQLRRIVWAIIVGFMIAWHNVYHEKVMLTEETNIEIADEGSEETKDAPIT